ncbi:MAG: anti-anti-sigma factor [Microbacteriaceae bacterium]|jgi:anti-sigma B factor antagonist|nr:anti-anti-sigma factor [Microbacteriaceae bacterium]
MNVTVKRLDQGVAIIYVTGKLNLVSAGSLREAVTETVDGAHPRISVDLTGVDFMDSSGLGALIGGLKTARQAGGDLRIAAPSDQVKLVLQLTNMDRVLTAYDHAESAYANG